MDQTETYDRWQRLFAKPLLIFVLVSVGFALGRLTAPAPAPAPVASPAGPQDPTGEVTTGPSRVVVTYLHGNIRCITCNTIEKTLREVVERSYRDALTNGRIVWREVNFDEDPALARRYGVESSSPVISWEINGREAGFKKVEGVMNLVRDPVAFEDTVAGIIDAAFAELPGKPSPIPTAGTPETKEDG